MLETCSLTNDYNIVDAFSLHLYTTIMCGIYYIAFKSLPEFNIHTRFQSLHSTPFHSLH